MHNNKAQEQGSQFRRFLENFERDFEYANAYQALFVNLKLTGSQEPPKVVLVASPAPNDGKSTVASNLAIAGALAGARMVLVDADMRRPTLQRLFALPSRSGFAEVLSSREPIAKVLDPKRVTEQVGKRTVSIDVVASGRPSSLHARYLDSDVCREVLQLLRDRYDMVIVDSPPVLAVSDAVVLARWADGVILVLNPGATRKDDAAECRERLEKAGGDVLGTVLNRFDARQHGEMLYRHSGYYNTVAS